MFDNIGGKLKGLAYFTAIGGGLICGIIAFVLLFISPASSISFFILIASCIFSSWTMYGLGELIESSISTESMMAKIIAQQAEPKKVIDTKKDERTGTLNTCNRSFFVKNYYPELPIQAVEFQIICKENREVFAKLNFYNYMSTTITGVNVDIEFITVFGDKWTFNDFSCLQLKADGANLYANEQLIHLDSEKIQSIKSVFIYIRKYLTNDNVVINSMQSKEIMLSEKELSDLKYMVGINAVTPYLDKADAWTCICGTDNDQRMAECKLCKKSRLKNMDSDMGDLNILIEKLESLNSAREMEDYLVEYNRKYNNERLDRFLITFKSTVQFERLYGNQKKDALKIIKKELGLKTAVEKPEEKPEEIPEVSVKEYCRKCGVGITPNAVFCQRCGTRRIPETGEQ